MDSGEGMDESAIEILPKGLNPWLNIGLVLVYVALALYLSHRLIQRRKLS
jgi:hypothetical protein